MGEKSDILVERRGPIATVIFHRLKFRNAFNLAMWDETARVTSDLTKDDSVRAIIFRGAGTEAFASGADISEFKEQRKDTETALRYSAHIATAFEAIRACPKPMVAMIFGYCMGGAMAIAAACDLRFAAEGARFGIPSARLGIIYGVDAVSSLVSLMGPAHVKDLLFSARTLSDREALQIGFIQRLLPPDQLESYVYEYLGRVADNAPLSVRGAKATVTACLENLTEERRRRLKEISLEAYESEDYQEGVKAFLEKRPPIFRGR